MQDKLFHYRYFFPVFITFSFSLKVPTNLLNHNSRWTAFLSDLLYHLYVRPLFTYAHIFKSLLHVTTITFVLFLNIFNVLSIYACCHIELDLPLGIIKVSRSYFSPYLSSHYFFFQVVRSGTKSLIHTSWQGGRIGSNPFPCIIKVRSHVYRK